MTMSYRRLKHVARIRASSVDKKSVEGDAAVRLCNYVDVYKNDLITPDLHFMEATAAPSQIADLTLRAGDVLITKDSESPDDIGVPAYVPQDIDGVVCGYHLSILRPSVQLIEPRYLAWVIASESSRQYFGTRANGITRFALSYSDIGELPVPLPAMEEQQAVVRFLDEETAKIDALIQAKVRLSALLLENQESLITELLWPEHVPQGWLMTPLMYLTQPQRPIMYGIVLPGPNVPDGVPVVKGGDVSNNRLRVDSLNRTSHEIEAPYARARLRGGDVVLTIRGRYGDAGLVPEELTGANITQDIARIAPRRGVSSNWLLRVLQSKPITTRINSEAAGAAVKGVNIKDVKRYQVPTPPPAEQNELAKEIDDVMTQARGAQSRIKTSLERLSEYRLALITAAVTGQMDVGAAA